MLLRTVAALALVVIAVPLRAAQKPALIPVEDGRNLEMIHVVPKTVTYQGHKALRLDPDGSRNGEALALLTGSDFADGTIEVDLAGRPAAGADDAARGFVGIAFRSAPHAASFECFYLRPTNGRADDQLRRNHSTQYVSEPEFPWQRLRTETPGVYESYVDLVTGAWTHVKIEVTGLHARLFVNGGAQPVLVVNDLKHGASRGQIGLWSTATTEAYFSNLRVSQ